MPYSLPAKHRIAHDFALHLHDNIVALIRSGEESQLFQVPIELELGEDRELESLEGEELFAWLEARKGVEVTLEMEYKALIQALVADFCHFVLEGLKCASRGKLTVAYALFRKPLKDNLFFFEWLLADPADFLARFRSGDPKQIDVGRVPPERKKEIISGAIEKGSGPGLTPEAVYEARYNRRTDTSMAGAWDQAIHLVTTWKASQTSPQNLNFIFSGPAAWNTQWANIYWSVPFLLYHATFVINCLFETLGEADETYRHGMEIRRAIGYELWAEYTRGEARQGVFHPALQRHLTMIPTECTECHFPLRHHRRGLRRYFLTGALLCAQCHHEWIWPAGV